MTLFVLLFGIAASLVLGIVVADWHAFAVGELRIHRNRALPTSHRVNVADDARYL